MFRAAAITFRRLLRRPATWLLIYSSRFVIALWARSIAHELRRPGRFDSRRFTALLRGLWSETTSTGFTARPPTKLVTVLDDGTPFFGGSTPTPESYEPRREIHLDPLDPQPV